jgi:hypothetical protein
MSSCARPWLALALLIFASACASIFGAASRVALSSDPSGAIVHVNGKDSGFVTPCVLDLDDGDAVRVEIAYPGYESAKRLLLPDWNAQAILWEEMYIKEGIWRFPLWLNTKDFFTPIKLHHRMVPNRVYVRLVRTADSS